PYNDQNAEKVFGAVGMPTTMTARNANRRALWGLQRRSLLITQPIRRLAETTSGIPIGFDGRAYSNQIHTRSRRKGTPSRSLGSPTFWTVLPWIRFKGRGRGVTPDTRVAGPPPGAVASGRPSSTLSTRPRPSRQSRPGRPMRGAGPRRARPRRRRHR